MSQAVDFRYIRFNTFDNYLLRPDSTSSTGAGKRRRSSVKDSLAHLSHPGMSTVLDPLENGADPSRIVVIVGQGGVQTDLDLDSLADSEIADAIPHLLADYSAECKDWTVVAGEHWKKGRWARVNEVLDAGFKFFAGSPGRPPDNMALVHLRSMMAHVLLAQARIAPQKISTHAKYDKISPDTKLKDFYYTEAAYNLNAADEALRSAGPGGMEDEPVSLSMGKIILYLARGQPNIAHPLVDRLLQRQPNNIIALSAQARLQFAKRNHDQALQTYQTLLNVKPDMKPDPRIGLGLCAWVLGDKERAGLAWERSLELDPANWVALLLLGLASLNIAREPSTTRDERIRLESEGVGHVQKAFKINNRCSAAALALSTATGQSGQLPLASKLAERAVQYADTKRHAVLANAERGRLGFVAGDIADAGPFIAAVKAEDAAGVNIMAELTLGQIAIKNGNLREALNFIEQTAKRLNGKGPIEYTVLHACLLSYPHPGMPADEIARNRKTARQMLSDVHSSVVSADSEEEKAKLRGVAEDVDLFLDLATLWHGESVDKAIGAYQTASNVFRASSNQEDGEEEQKKLDVRQVRTASNLGSLFLLRGNVDSAEREYQLALEKLASETGQDAEILKTDLAYNLARAYEENGEVVKASQWYRDVLRQHPEHMESKVRLAMLAAAAGRNVDAHTLLKECLRADETNITLRSSYTHFLISIGSHKEALAFTSSTLKHERNDPFTFCALGWLHFTLGREAKSSADVAERPKQYLRSAEAYERALTLDPRSAMAAQGLAIALAEDTLSPPGSTNAADEAKLRQKLAGQALGIFSRINDCLLDGSGNVNMGHCHFTRGDEEKAIQSYEAGLSSSRTQSVPILLYLARAWYAWATRESNISGMSKALSYCQQAMHIQPSDRAILYNIAMIQQKSAELLFGLEPSKRTSEEVQVAIGQAQQAVNTFRALANDKAGALPYDADLADQRARYGDGLLRRAPEQVSRQEAYESEAQARVEEARKVRAAEQERIRAAEEQRRAELAAKAEEIAAVRRQAQEEARQWAEEEAARAAEDEARRATNAEKRRKKVKDEIISGDEGEGAAGSAAAPKRKRKAGAAAGGKKNRKVRSKSEISSEEDEAVLSGDEEVVQRQREMGSGGEEETEEMVQQRKQDTLAMLRARAKKKKAAKPVPEAKGKQYKSKEIISDSEEEGEDADEDEASVPANAGNGRGGEETAEPTTAGTSALSDAGAEGANGTASPVRAATEEKGMDVDS